MNVSTHLPAISAAKFISVCIVSATALLLAPPADAGNPHDTSTRAMVLNGQAEIDALKVQVSDLQEQMDSMSLLFAGLQAKSHVRYTNSEAQAASAESGPPCEDWDLDCSSNSGGGGGGDPDPRFEGVERLTVDGVDTLRFTGMNLQIVNGMGGSTSSSTNGHGNLIIGYNETNETESRGGSHNLVVGPYHSYNGQSGAVFGWDNWIDTDFASITGGKVNTISDNGNYASISGGSQNWAEGSYSSIHGGVNNHARNGGAVVLGGYGNKAYSIRTVVTGGNSVTCTTPDGVCGG
jgi:hypothetical protein